jgi:hypothetical protein
MGHRAVLMGLNKDKQQQRQKQMRGFFAPLRMTIFEEVPKTIFEEVPKTTFEEALKTSLRKF